MTDRRSEIASALQSIETRVESAARLSGRSRKDISLIVVTKTYPESDVAILLDLGVVDFGENRESEGREKSSVVSGRWHFQGEVQSNKIGSIARWADVVHSLDNPKHISKFDSAVEEGKVLSVFLQVSLDHHTGGTTRGGASPQDLDPLAELALSSPHLNLLGLMAVAPLDENPSMAFHRLSEIHADFRSKFPSAPYLSAGMSGDFEEAIAYGATHIRIGSSILGVRSLQR